MRGAAFGSAVCFLVMVVLYCWTGLDWGERPAFAPAEENFVAFGGVAGWVATGGGGPGWGTPGQRENAVDWEVGRAARVERSFVFGAGDTDL